MPRRQRPRAVKLDPNPPQFLFAWLAALASGLMPTARGDILLNVAILLGQNGDAATGNRIWIDADALADRLGVTSRTIWRKVDRLVDLGWLAKVSEPSEGRKARYQATIPDGARVTAPGGTVSHVPDGSRLTGPGVSVSHVDPATCDTAERDGVTGEDRSRVTQLGGSRVTDLGVTCDIAERERVTQPTYLEPTQPVPTSVVAASSLAQSVGAPVSSSPSETFGRQAADCNAREAQADLDEDFEPPPDPDDDAAPDWGGWAPPSPSPVAGFEPAETP